MSEQIREGPALYGNIWKHNTSCANTWVKFPSLPSLWLSAAITCTADPLMEVQTHVATPKSALYDRLKSPHRIWSALPLGDLCPNLCHREKVGWLSKWFLQISLFSNGQDSPSPTVSSRTVSTPISPGTSHSCQHSVVINFIFCKAAAKAICLQTNRTYQGEEQKVSAVPRTLP